MKKIRFLAALLGLGVMLSTAVSAFTDMPADEKLANALNNAVANGILSGYPEDDTIRPDSFITRAEMASIITRACGATVEGNISGFGDMNPEKWYYPAMAKAYSMGAFSGDDKKNMNPENNITFQECFTVLSRVFDLYPEYTYNPAIEALVDLPETKLYSPSDRRLYDVSIIFNYPDGADVAAWARPFYAGLLANGAWSGENGYLTPTQNITRGQFATVMNNIVQNYIDAAGTYTELPAGNTMIRCNDVILEGVKADGSVYVADGVGFQRFAANNVALARLVVRGCSSPLGENGKPVSKDIGLKLSGRIDRLRIVGSNISVNVSEVVHDYPIYSSPTTSINLGNVSF